MQANTSPDGPETPRRVPPKITPRRPHSGGDVPDGGAPSRSSTNKPRTDSAPIAMSESEASSPEKDCVRPAGTSPGPSPGPSPGGPNSATPMTAFSERIGKKLSAVGAEADKWAGASAAGSASAANSLSLSPLDQLIVRPASPKPGRSSAQSDCECAHALLHELALALAIESFYQRT